jgi:hypothetical protein
MHPRAQREAALRPAPASIQCTSPHPPRADVGQYEFLRELHHPRFLELRKMCGAEQGANVNRNQLLDAFHLWSAEHHDCEYLLSLDFKLARVISNSKKKPLCRVVGAWGGRGAVGGGCLC